MACSILTPCGSGFGVPLASQSMSHVSPKSICQYGSTPTQLTRGNTAPSSEEVPEGVSEDRLRVRIIVEVEDG